jgi:solute:Na+ symporter, SSS family
LMSGVNMYAMAVVMQVVLGWNIHFSIWVSSLTVGIYVALGGLYSAIFNEVLQFFLIWLGALLIPILGLVEAGGWSGLVARIHQNFPGENLTHLWADLGHFSSNPMGIQWTGIVFGLGAVLSMGYWTTDFLVVQRVIAAKDIRSAKMAPVIGAFFKMAVPFIVILPGLLGLAVLPFHLYPTNLAHAGEHTYNQVLPLMMARYLGPGLLGLGITALVAGFMSGMAGNVSAFATVWTYDIYRVFFRKDATDEHYVTMGRWCTIIGLIISIGAAYAVMGFASIMDYVQALFAIFIAPLFGTVLMGMLWKRVTSKGSFWGLLAGVGSSAGMFLAVKLHPSALAIIALSSHAKMMAQDMYQALWSWLICVGVTIVVSMFTQPAPAAQLQGLVYGETEIPSEGHLPFYQRPLFWSGVCLAVFLVLQWIFW